VGIAVAVTLVLAALPALLLCQRVVKFACALDTLLPVAFVFMIFALFTDALHVFILSSVSDLPRQPAVV
jgi:hypothetical protein